MARGWFAVRVPGSGLRRPAPARRRDTAPYGAVDEWAIARASARGLLAAMAMSGMRGFTANIGLLKESPPKAIVERHAPEKVQRLSPEQKSAIAELAHWAYGAAGGAAFGLLPAGVRADPRTGPVYGLGIWLLFEFGIAPLLGIRHPRDRRRRLLHRVMLALDHSLYGIVVAGRLAPAPEVRPA
jgi:hypothetical protein